MHIYLFLIFLLTTELVKAESPPVNTWNSENERTLHGPVPSFLLSLPCPSEGYFRHPKYCSQFYRCVDIYGSKRALSLFRGTCDPGLVFDEKISSCNWPDLSPSCIENEISRQPVHPQDPQPSQFEITSQPDFSSPQSEIVQQVFEVFTEVSTTKSSFTTQRPSEHQVQQEQLQQQVQQEEIWQQLVPQQVPQEVQRPIIQQVHQQQSEQRVQQEVHHPQTQQEVYHPQTQQEVHHPQTQQEIQQTEHQQLSQQQIQQQFQQDEQKVHPQEQQVIQQEPHQTQHHQEHHQQQIQVVGQQGTSGSDWWIPDEEYAWTTKATEHDVQNIITSEELLCRKEGFFQHPGNCSKFYRCVRRSESFEIFVFECPQFLVFNQSGSACHRSENQACVTHEAAYRSLRTKRSASESRNKLDAATLPCPEEGFYRHPRHCQVFYRCVQTRNRNKRFSIHTFVCPKNLVFDEENGTCDWPEKSAPCSENSMSISSTIPPPSRTTRKPLRTTRQPPRTTQQPLRTTKQQPRPTRQPLRRTTRQPSGSTRQPSRTTQQLSATRQPPSKQKSKVKNDSRTSQVQRRPNIPHDQVQRRPNTPRPVGQGRDKLKLTQSTERPRTQTQPITVLEVHCRAPGFFTNRSDCNKYYKCVDRSGKGQYFLRYDFACPQNLAFDEVSRTCKSPDRVAYCKRSQNLAVPQDDDSQTETTSAASNESPKTEEQTSKSKGGDKECKKEGFFRDPEDCNKFYRCVDFNGDGKQFVRYDFSCPEDTVFDEENGVCNWPSAVPECDNEGSKGSESNSGGDGNEGSESSESNSGSDGNEGSDSDGSDKPAPSETESPQTGSSSTDSGEASSDSKSTEDSQSQSTTEKTSSEGETESSSSGGDGSSSTTSSTDIQCTEEGFFRHPDDCNKFYRCVDFQGDGKEYVRYDFKCPEGLVFDETNGVCNWPSSSEPCDSGSSSGPSDGGGTTSGTTSQSQGTSDGTSEGQGTSDGTSEGQGTSDGTSEGQSTSDGTSQGQGTSTSSGTSDTVTDSTTQAQTDSTEGASETSGSSKGTTESSSTSDHTDSSEQESSSQTSSTSKSNDGECKEEGYFRHPEDCSKFYRCVDFKGDGKQFVRYDFSCPEGLEFDEENSVCNWPSSDSPCSGNSSKGEGTQSPSSSSTSGTDSSSTSDKDSTTSTPREDKTEEETSESSEKEETSSQTESSSSSSDTSTSSSSDTTTASTSGTSTSSSSDSSTSSSSDSSTSSTSATSTTSDDSSEPEGGEEVTSESSASESGSTSDDSRPSSNSDCTEEGFFRNSDDCSKFYRCVDFNGDGKQFVRYDFDCPEGLVFDEVNSVCNWPDSSPPCDGEPGESGETTATSSEGATDSATNASSGPEQTTTEGTTDSTADTSSGPGQTTTAASSEGTTESVTDAQSTTSETTEASPETEITESQSETSTSSTETSSSETTDSSPSGTTSSEGSDECTEEGYFRDPEDCSKFHRCVDSKGDGKEFKRYDFQCPDGLVFDDTKNKCNWPEESPPCESGSEKEQTTEASGGTQTETDSTSEEQTTEASGGTDSTSEEKTTEASGGTQSQTDSTSSTTDSGDDSTTASTQSEDCTEEGFFRDPSDCRKYYRCIEKDDGTFEKQEFSCQEDEVFDPEGQFCDKKELNPSCPDSTTEGTQSTTDATETTKTEMSSTSGSTSPPEESSTAEGEKTTSSSETDSSSTSKSSAEKECTEEGFFRDPDDCSKFYRCVDFEGDGKSFVRYDFECPEGLVFDEEISVCNWPGDVPECESSGTEGGTSSSSATEKDSGTTSSTTSQGETSSSSTTETDSATTSSTTSQGETSSSSAKETDSATTSSSTSQGQTDSSSTTASSSSGTSSSTTSSESKDTECTEEGFFRDPDDCTKFYRCVDFNGDGKQFVRYDFECPEGLVFDETISVCNWPQDSPPCEDGSDNASESSTSTDSGNKESSQESTSSEQSGTTESTTSESGGQTTGTTSSSKTTTASGTRGTTSSSKGTTASETQGTTSSSSSRTTTDQQEKESGKSECKEEGYFRDPEDCTKYYRCLKNNETGELEKKEFECPEDHVFDEEGRYCNSKELSPPCNSSGSFECTEEGFFRDPEDCTKYIQCKKRNDSDTYEQKRFQCPEDHVFDEEGRYCNAKEFAPPCDDEEEDKSSTTSGEATTEGQQEGEDSTTSEETTSEGQQEGEDSTTSEETTSEGHQEGEDSTTSGETTSEGKPDEDQSSSDSFECKEEGFFRDPEDCTKYYQCSKNNDSSETFEKKKFSCPENHVFDEEGRYCNSVDLAPPCNESETSATTSDGSSTQARTTGSSTNGATEDSTSRSSTEGSRAKTTDNGGTDSTSASSSSSSSRATSQGSPECTEEGFFRNPNDCSKFYRCVDFSGSGESFVRYDFDCPEGLVFDEINSICTWPTLYPPCENNKDNSETSIYRPPAE